MKDQTIIESTVCYSSIEGGNTLFRREDLQADLYYEMAYVDSLLDLTNIDKELHDAYATRYEYIEVKHLHGYDTLMWINHARMALGRRQDQLISQTASREVVDDILDWMLEGWYFGETCSHQVVQGYVPSIDPTNILVTKQDQIKHSKIITEKKQKRDNAEKQGIMLDIFTKGDLKTKATIIDREAQKQKTDILINQQKNRQAHLLDESETTIRFGLFMLTLMYFRSMNLIAREKKSWSCEFTSKRYFQDKPTASTSVERKKMMEEEENINKRKLLMKKVMDKCRVGERRLKQIRDDEQNKSFLRQRELKSLRIKQVKAVVVIQRSYRNYTGRRIAKKWQTQFKELVELNMQLNSSAVSIQRIWKGYVARKEAKAVKKDMARFIALMRFEEASADEDLYWNTHPFSRFKNNQINFFKKTIIGRVEEG